MTYCNLWLKTSTGFLFTVNLILWCRKKLFYFAIIADFSVLNEIQCLNVQFPVATVVGTRRATSRSTACRLTPPFVPTGCGRSPVNNRKRRYSCAASILSRMIIILFGKVGVENMVNTHTNYTFVM